MVACKTTAWLHNGCQEYVTELTDQSTKSLISQARRVIFSPFGEVAEWLKALPC